MPKYGVTISCSEWLLGRLTVRFRWFQDSWMVALAPVDVRQEGYVELLPWIGLQTRFRSPTFSSFFQFWFCDLGSFLVMSCVCLACVCNKGCIRLKIWAWIHEHWRFWIWYDSPWTSFLICQKIQYLVMICLDSNLVISIIILKTCNDQKDTIWLRFGFYLDLN